MALFQAVGNKMQEVAKPVVIQTMTVSLLYLNKLIRSSYS